MKTRKRGAMFRRFFALSLAGGMVLWSTANLAAQAVTNTGSGTIGGTAGTLNSATINLNVQTLGITKKVYDLSLTELADGSNVAKGQELYILIFVDNTLAAQVNDARVTDNLDDANGDGTTGDTSGLTYLAGSLQRLTSVTATGATAGTNAGGGAGWFHSGTWTTITEAADGSGTDNDKILAATGAGATAVVSMGKSNAGNDKLNLLPSSITAFRFRVTVN